MKTIMKTMINKNFWRLLLISLTFLLTVETGAAQEATEITSTPVLTPTATLPAFVLTSSLELASVEVFRSNFILNPPASDFQRVTLTLNQEGWTGSGEPIEVDLSQVASVVSPFTEFTY
ncbi:MAG TPA: hypothetical protein VHL11_05770, partial [Phototrophicaceae bacterium]|nr:hypothetical protein [Phototrophicaceae bacterium]